MKTQTVRKTAQAKKGPATKVVRRKAAETEDDDDTRVKKMVQVRRRILSSINKNEMGYLDSGALAYHNFSQHSVDKTIRGEVPVKTLLPIWKHAPTLRFFCTREPSYSD